MTQEPLITVVVPLYNKERWIGRCLDSITAQSYKNLEILIVNDGSSDNSVEVVNRIEDRRIRVIDKPNGGVSSARNRGMDEAKGEFIAFLDADDMWMSRHIEALLEGFRNHPNATIVSNRLDDRINGQNMQKKSESTETFVFTDLDYLFELSEDRFPIHIGSTMYKKSTIDTYGTRFFEHMYLGEDVNFMIRVSRFGTCLLSDYTGMVYCHDDDASAMHKQSENVVITPLFLEGLQEESWSKKEHGFIIKFLRREYLKKAYQNRGLSWDKQEGFTKLSGDIEVGRICAMCYMLIRYIPEAILNLLKKLH